MPGEPMTSSIVPLSTPGCRPARGSPPPALGRWHVPQAMLPSLESCSSQNKILPSTRFGSVIGFSTGTGTGGKPAQTEVLAAIPSSISGHPTVRMGAFYRLGVVY